MYIGHELSAKVGAQLSEFYKSQTDLVIVRYRLQGGTYIVRKSKHLL